MLKLSAVGQLTPTAEACTLGSDIVGLMSLPCLSDKFCAAASYGEDSFKLKSRSIADSNAHCSGETVFQDAPKNSQAVAILEFVKEPAEPITKIPDLVECSSGSLQADSQDIASSTDSFSSWFDSEEALGRFAIPSEADISSLEGIPWQPLPFALPVATTVLSETSAQPKAAPVSTLAVPAVSILGLDRSVEVAEAVETVLEGATPLHFALSFEFRPAQTITVFFSSGRGNLPCVPVPDSRYGRPALSEGDPLHQRSLCLTLDHEQSSDPSGQNQSGSFDWGLSVAFTSQADSDKAVLYTSSRNELQKLQQLVNSTALDFGHGRQVVTPVRQSLQYDHGCRSCSRYYIGSRLSKFLLTQMQPSCSIDLELPHGKLPPHKRHLCWDPGGSDNARSSASTTASNIALLWLCVAQLHSPWLR